MTIHPDPLRAFVAVVDCGGVPPAARRLLRGQSAVSLHVKRLADSLGVKLRERNAPHLPPTSEGRCRSTTPGACCAGSTR